MRDQELLDLSLVAVAGMIARGEVSSREVTQASIAAFERHNPALNCVADGMDGLEAEKALEEADRCDADRAAGRLRGPLHGVPMAHKDMYYRAGRACSVGSRLRGGFVPKVTASALERLDEAGAIDLGRLNMVEFALGITGHNAITGHPRNPWNTDYMTGGSSSGPVAAVAARLTYASLGSDTGGSIRIPATCTGLVGIKPTYGRVSRAGAMPLSHSLDHVGPLTRTAEDAALLLQILSGHDPRDYTTSTRDVPPYWRLLSRDLKGLRVAVPRVLEIEPAPEVAKLLEDSRRQLVELGATLVEVDVPPLGPLGELRKIVMLGEVAGRHEPWIRHSSEAYNPQTLGRMEAGMGLRATDYVRAMSMRAQALRTFHAAVFEKADVLHLPTMPHPVARLDDTDTGGSPEFFRLVQEIGFYIFPFNYLGLPTISIPIGLTGNGLPMGMQIIGRPFDETSLLRIAHHFEKATNWAARKPPLAA